MSKCVKLPERFFCSNGGLLVQRFSCFRNGKILLHCVEIIKPDGGGQQHHKAGEKVYLGRLFGDTVLLRGTERLFRQAEKEGGRTENHCAGGESQGVDARVVADGGSSMAGGVYKLLPLTDQSLVIKDDRGVICWMNARDLSITASCSCTSGGICSHWKGFSGKRDSSIVIFRTSFLQVMRGGKGI